jgi:hypothetical protein
MLRRSLICALALLALLVGTRASAQDAGQYALIVSGASAGEPYAGRYERWRDALAATLRDRFHYPPDHVIVLGETAAEGVGPATRIGVQEALGELRTRVGKNDQLLVVLIGHGTAADGDHAKFNLVGPDLSADEWASLLAPIAGHLIFVDTTAGSAPFLHTLARPGRIVLTANDTAAQQFETVFPEYLVQAFQDPAADANKDGRVSVWEAFVFASDGVRTHFEAAAQLPSERPVLDDNGDGIGREAAGEGRDGDLARATFLAPETQPATTDPAVAALIQQRAALQAALDRLRALRDRLPPDQYEAELQRLLVDIARLSQQIRAR